MKESDMPCVFLSWSGEQSRKVAEDFNILFKAVFTPTISSFKSDRDIGAGARSIGTLFKMLEQCNFGICFINNENIRAPWIQFEAGALSKIVDDSRVMVLLLDENCIDSLYGMPLNEFQHKLFNKEDVKSIFEEIIKVFGQKDSKDAFLQRFESGWEDFYCKAQDVLKEKNVKEKTEKPVRYAEKEELETIKKMLLNVQNLQKTDTSQILSECLELFEELKRIIKIMSPEELKDVQTLFKVQRYSQAFHLIIRRIEEVIDDLEAGSEGIDTNMAAGVKEKLNKIIEGAMPLITD